MGAELGWARGVGRGMEALEQTKTPGCTCAKGYGGSGKEQTSLQLRASEKKAAVFEGAGVLSCDP